MFLASCTKSSEQLKSEFFAAVKADDCAKATRLIKEGFNVNEPETSGGWSGLHFAAQIGSEEMVRALLAIGANPNYIGTAPGQEGTILSMKPLVVSQASLGLAEAFKSNPSLRIENLNALMLERLRDDRGIERWKRVCAILDKVTFDDYKTNTVSSAHATIVRGISH